MGTQGSESIGNGRVPRTSGTADLSSDAGVAAVLPSAAGLGEALAVLAIVAAGVVAAQFAHPVAYQAPTLRATCETVMTLIAVAGAWLLGLRFIRTWSLRDLLLFTAVLMLALVEFATYAVPAIYNNRAGGQAGAAAQWGTALVAAMFVLAAVCPKERLVNPRQRPILVSTAAAAALMGTVELWGSLTQRDLVALAAQGSHAVAHIRFPLGWTLAIGTAMLFSHAALRIGRQANRNRDGVLALLAGALILLAASRLSSLALRWSSPREVSQREALRLLAFALLLAAAVHAEVQARVRSMRAAMIVERRRIARDLHDGLAQDLAFLAGNVSRISTRDGTDDPLAVAARRALALSRGAIRDLSNCRSNSTVETLESIGQELQERFGIEVAVDVRLDHELGFDTREQIARITREAIVNAAKHGEPEHVIVSLMRMDARLTLRVADDGRGLPDGSDRHPHQEGFGLRSMRERATVLGGRLTLRDLRGGGAELELVLPR
jgi:signal transduction histidine kinase